MASESIGRWTFGLWYVLAVGAALAERASVLDGTQAVSSSASCSTRGAGVVHPEQSRSSSLLQVTQGSAKTIRLPVDDDGDEAAMASAARRDKRSSGANVNNMILAALAESAVGSATAEVAFAASSAVRSSARITREKTVGAASLLQGMATHVGRKMEKFRTGAGDLFFHESEPASSSGSGLFLILAVVVALMGFAALAILALSQSDKSDDAAQFRGYTRQPRVSSGQDPFASRDVFLGAGPQPQMQQQMQYASSATQQQAMPGAFGEAQSSARAGNSKDSLGPSPSQPPSAKIQGAPPAAAPPLCAALVVPEDSRCSLMVPPLRKPTGKSCKNITVDDARNCPLFRVSFAVDEEMAPRTLKLSLTSTTGETLFASARKKAEDLALEICDQDGRHYGTLEMNDAVVPASTFTFTPMMGHRIVFKSDAKLERLEAKSDDGRLCAVLDPIGPDRRTVIVGPLVDAGLVVICLLGIDWLRQDLKS